MNVYPLDVEAAPMQLEAHRSGSAGIAVWLPVIAAAAMAALIQGFWIPLDADVSWLITVCERVVSGNRLYVDILEVNPPASVWMYMPAVWLAHAFGARPEAMVVATFIGAALLSVYATVRLTQRSADSPDPASLALVLAIISLVLPMALFAQREHAAMLLAFPVIAALTVIAEGKPLRRSVEIACGVAAGLLVVIKPYFLLAIIGPAIWAAWKRHSIWPLLPGLASAAIAVAIYGAAIFLFARPYFDWMEVILHTYAHVHERWWIVLVGPTIYPAICLGLVALLRAPRIPQLAICWALGAAGFLLAALMQAKAYPNHWLPQAGLALAAAFAVLMFPQIAKGRRLAVGAGLAFVAICAAYRWTLIPDPALAAAIEQVAPPAPKVISLSTELTTGHPVTRNVGGQWVGSRAALFTAAGARLVGLGDPIGRRAYRDDIQSFGTDVAANSPDVVLVDRSAAGWLMREPVVARAMSGYRPATRVQETEVWVKRGRITSP